MVHFTVVLGGQAFEQEAKGDLVMTKPCCFSNVNDFVIMLTRYWSPSHHSQLQLHFKSKAWQLSIQL